MKMLTLIWLQLRVNFGLSALNWYRKKDIKKLLGSLGIIALVFMGIGPIFFLYLRLLQEMYKAALRIGQTQLVLVSALVLSSLLVLVFALSFVMSVFYFSRDLSLLVPLPLFPSHILGAKFVVVLIYDYLTISPFYLPALWVYGNNTGAGPLFWLTGMAVFLLLPVIPLAIASTFVLFLMGVTNLSRRRDTLRIISLFAFLAILLSFNFFVSRIPVGEEAEFIERLLLDEQGLIRFVSRVYPPAFFASQALTARGSVALANFVLFLGLSLAGLALTLFTGEKIFYRGLIGGAEVQRGKAVSREVLERKMSRSASAAWTIALKEIKYLIRTPIYLFNSIAMLAVVPLALIIPVITGGGLNNIIDSLTGITPRAAQVLGGAAFIGVMALFTPAASSSFSREGKQFWISKVIPVPPGKQIQGKVLYSLMIASLALPLVALAALLFLPWSVAEVALVLFSGLILSFPAITLSLLIDLLRPYLTWDSPQKAIKQNINVLLAMVAGGGLYFLLYIAGRAVYQATGAELPVYIVVLGGAALLGGVFYAVLLKIAPGRYRDISI